MKEEAYPALYKSANDASIKHQRHYLWGIRLQYVLLIISSCILIGISYSIYLVYAYIISLIISALFLVYFSTKKPEKDWYASRALAESVKTLTWRYMMWSEPFDGKNIDEVKSSFVDELRSSVDSNSHARNSITISPVQGNQISEEMDQVRSMNLKDRKEFYLLNRIQDQRKWYSKKVDYNRKSFIIWIFICVAVQASAIFLAILRVEYYENWALLPVEPLLVVASAMVGWVQIKKFNELASAYSITAHEIGMVESSMPSSLDEDSFSEFVNEAERAFSREHTQWVARRNE